MAWRSAARAAPAAAVAAALALPGAAAAGGFATVGLSSLPDGTPPGRPWDVRLTVLQHGRTPMSNLRPVVRIRRAGGGPARDFAAAPAGRPGVYRARVVFPSAGRWTYVVDDGFTQSHAFAPVRIGGTPAAPPAVAAPGERAAAARPSPRSAGESDGGDAGAALGAAAVAGTLAALLVLRGRRRPSGAPSP